MAIPSEVFFLDRQSEVSLQAQLRRQIITAILEGRLRAGERLPSGRKLAERLGIARVTVAQAYAELVASDYLVSRNRSGFYVADKIEALPMPPAPAPLRGFNWDRVLDKRLSAAERKDRVPDWRRYRYPFVYGQADPALVDHTAWRNCALRALGRREFVSLTGDLYDNDDPGLVDYILRNILPRRGIRARPDQVLLTLGAQNGLWLAATVMLARHGAPACIEDPCYPGLRTILSQSGAPTIPLPVDAEGLDPEQIPARIAALFTTASHHSPTGAAMPKERRDRLLERALSEGFAIIEDDYEFEMSFAGAPSPALKASDAGGAVIYVGSFSKSVFPGLRLGYVVADPRVLHEMRALRTLSLRHPPGMLQRTLMHFLALGHYDTQMNRMRRVYAARRAAVAQALESCGLTTEPPSARGGSSFWLMTPGGLASDRLAAELRGRDVLIEPGGPFFASASQGAGFYRLAYSSIDEARIPEGIARIAEVASPRSLGRSDVTFLQPAPKTPGQRRSR